MDIAALTKLAVTVKSSYAEANQKDGHKTWTSAEYMQGFVGDVGELAKLIMAKNNYRHIENVDQKISHELADCLWSILVIADELSVNLEAEFINTMDELKQKLSVGSTDELSSSN